MADEYIRLDITIMGIDGLINEAPTGSQARALLCAKDMIYDQQRYVSKMKPVKHGEWDFQGDQLFKCTNCKEIFTQNQLEAMQNHIDQEEFTFPNFCPNCGADMRGDTNE